MKIFALLALSNIALATFTCYQCESSDQHGTCAKGKDMPTQSGKYFELQGAAKFSIRWFSDLK